jgi:hypothetical protein
MKRKAEDENEDEDDGCRSDRVPTNCYRLFRAESAEAAEANR